MLSASRFRLSRSAMLPQQGKEVDQEGNENHRGDRSLEYAGFCAALPSSQSQQNARLRCFRLD